MKKSIISLIGGAALSFSVSGLTVDAASDYLQIADENGKIQKTPWVTNTPLGASNLDAERAVVAIHSSGRNAIWYYEGIEEAANMAGELDNTLLYSLQFLTAEDIAENNLYGDYELNYWYSSHWKVGHKARENCLEHTATLDTHVSNGRATSQTSGGWWWFPGTTTYTAVGSGETLGTSGTTTATLTEKPYGYYKNDTCPTNVPTTRGWSTFSFVDVVLNEFLDEARFPNLKHVVVAGHSAGGQFVNRYAAGNLLDEQLEARGIEVTYVVSAPSTYMYMDTRRPDTAVAAVNAGNAGNNGQDDYGVTTNFIEADNSVCSGFNDYKHGLDSINSYMGAAGVSQIRSQYANRSVLYIVGEYDDIRASDGLENDCKANLEGRHRKERSVNYMNYMIDYYGESITEFHSQETVPEGIHCGPCLFQSDIGLSYMFPELGPQPDYPPEVEITAIEVGQTDTTVIGIASDRNDDLSIVEVIFQGASYTCSGTENWICSIPTPASPGTYLVDAIATDAKGYQSNIDQDSFVILESLPPEFGDIEWTIDGNLLTVEGTVTDPNNDLQSIILVGIGLPGPYACNGIANSFTCSLELIPGDYDLYLIAEDADGNSAESDSNAFTIPDGQECITSLNSEHVNAGRATMLYNILVYAAGSGQYIGIPTATTTLIEVSEGNWEQTTTCP